MSGRKTKGTPIHVAYIRQCSEEAASLSLAEQGKFWARVYRELQIVENRYCTISLPNSGKWSGSISIILDNIIYQVSKNRAIAESFISEINSNIDSYSRKNRPIFN